MKNVYFITMLIVYIIAHIGINSKYESKFLSRLSAFVIFVILVIISGFRTGIGDTFFYKHKYMLLVENPVADFKDKDVGFTFFMLLLAKLSKDPQILIFVTSFITNLFIVIALYKYSKPFEVGIFLYFGTVLYYVTMNGIRQSMVAAIMLWAVKYISEGRFIKYTALVLLLSTLHQSAIIFIPLYFLVRTEAWSRTFWITLGSALVFTIAFKPLSGTTAGLLESTVYENYGQDMLTNEETVNSIRVLITLVPLVLAYFVRDRLKNEWPESRIFIYMALFNFIFMLLGTQYLYFYRLCIYFDLFNLILIPKLLQFYGKQKGMSLYVYLILLYLVFCWYQVDLWHEGYKNVLLGIELNA